MNLDYIEETISLGKDKLCFDYLDWNASYKGAERFYFDRCNKIEVIYREALNEVKIKGSIPYFIKSHNYYSTIPEWIEGLEYIQGCLNINIFSGLIDKCEFGTIQEIQCKESEFLSNHIKVKGMETRDFKKGNVITGKEFHSSSLKIKIYDVNRNIKNKLEKHIRDEISNLYGWDKEKHYIKIENHYKKPEAFFKGNLYLNELLSNEYQKKCQIDLLNSYKSILKTGNIILPSCKSDINAGTIPLMILKELESIYNFNTEDLLRSKIKSIPIDILSPDDKKARQRILRDNLNKIRLQGVSEYDITELLEAKIKNEEVLLYV